MTLGTVACQAPQSVEFSRQEYWSGLPFPSPGDLPNPGIEPESLSLQADTLPSLQADALRSEPPGKPKSDGNVTQADTYMYPFSPKLPTPPGCHITLSRVLCTIHRTLLVIHVKYSSVNFHFQNDPMWDTLLFCPFYCGTERLNHLFKITQLLHSRAIGDSAAAAAAAKSLQSCPTLCDPIDGSPPGSSVHGIFQARVLEWGAIAFSESDSRIHIWNCNQPYHGLWS